MITQEHQVGNPQYSIELDLSFRYLWFIRPDGYIEKCSLERAIGHELFHTLLGNTDPLADYMGAGHTITQSALNYLGTSAADYVGDTVQQENIVGDLIGQGWDRISYFNGVQDDYFGFAESLTNAAVMTRILSLNDGATARGTDVDLHALAGDTLINLASNRDDRVIGSQGNDYIYGGAGNDKFYGNQGSDFIHGGSLVSTHASDGFDIADYSKWESYTAQTTNSINVTVAPSSAGTFGATASADVITVTDGHGGAGLQSAYDITCAQSHLGAHRQHH